MNYIIPALLFCALFFFGTFAVVSILPGPAHSDIAKSAGNVNGPVVLELFTSQSCSSCPPADKLLGELVQNDNVIALSCHVDYWNHLSWKDTQSHAFCTQRQRDYSIGQNRGGRIFTPELQVNGRYSTVGSRGSEVKRALEQASQSPPQKITVQVDEDGFISLALPDVTSREGSLNLRGYSYLSTVHQQIARGENRGRHVSYTNSVQKEFEIGRWDGGSKILKTKIKAQEIPQDGGFVVIGRVSAGPRAAGPVLAAGKF